MLLGMSNSQGPFPPDETPFPSSNGADMPAHEQILHSTVGARVPESKAQGVLCTGTIVLEGPNEFVIDFMQNLTRPPRVGARIVLSHAVMGQFVAALADSFQKYEQRFGPPKPMPRPANPNRPSIKEIYGDLRLADDQLSGNYATTVMIGHSPAEFFLDFITRFYPTAAVSSRVYMTASHIPGLLDTLNASLAQHRRNKPPQEPPSPPAEPPPTPGDPPAQM